MYSVAYGRRSSCPSHLTAPNGLNFSQSVGNPNSRLARVHEYLRVNGPRTKREILRDVFGRTIDPTTFRGWGSTFFSLGVRYGVFHKTRRGNVTFWSVN